MTRKQLLVRTVRRVLRHPDSRPQDLISAARLYAAATGAIREAKPKQAEPEEDGALRAALEARQAKAVTL